MSCIKDREFIAYGVFARRRIVEGRAQSTRRRRAEPARERQELRMAARVLKCIREVAQAPDGSLWMLEDTNPGALIHVTPITAATP